MKLLFSHNETPSIILTMEVGDLPIELEVADALKSGHLMMGTAESCTGGKIASMITSMAGSSEYFTGGVVAYCNEVKHHVLGVSEADLNTFGAVSQPVVEQMARGTMRVLGCDCAVATSGIAGPGGGTPSKPVGTVWIAAAYKERILSECFGSFWYCTRCYLECRNNITRVLCNRYRIERHGHVELWRSSQSYLDQRYCFSCTCSSRLSSFLPSVLEI